MARPEPHGSVRAIWYALGANLGIALAKAAAAALTGSGALLAEAVHSFADCTNQVLLFVGLARARRPVTDLHPLGTGKALYFWSFLVAVMLFSMGGMFSMYEGVRKLTHLEAGGGGVERLWVGIGVLSLGLVLEGFSLLGALRESRTERRGRGLWQWFRASRRSELLVVVGEDLAALVGLVLALVALGLTLVTGNPVYDALGTLAIGILLVAVAVAVGVEVKSLLIGESVDPELETRITGFLEQCQEVEQVFHLITLQLGHDVMVAVKARMGHGGTPRDLVDGINRTERALKGVFPEVRWVFFEPDVED